MSFVSQPMIICLHSLTSNVLNIVISTAYLVFCFVFFFRRREVGVLLCNFVEFGFILKVMETTEPSSRIPQLEAVLLDPNGISFLPGGDLWFTGQSTWYGQLHAGFYD